MKGVTDKTIKKLLEKYKQISLLGKIGAVLDWDLQVNLPSKASEARAAQSAYLTELVTDKWLDRELRDLLEDALSKKDRLNPKEQAIVRNLERASRYYHKVPKEIIIEISRTTSEAFIAWRQARETNQFPLFLPFLKKLVELNQIVAKHLGYKNNPYDALIDLYEPGLSADFCRDIFQKLQPNLTTILKKINKVKRKGMGVNLVSGQFIYPTQDQKQLATFILKKMGYDLLAGRMDISPHPFTTDLSRFDIRITNRYKEDDFRESVMIAMHETGHALYEQGINQEYEGTPLEGGVSLGIHESQSRFWENQVGRSSEFLEYATPIIQAFYQEQLAGVGSETLAELFNEVKPGFIRTEADEVTYNLHIILRFELEDALINGKIKAEDLPEIWRTKMKKYLGIVPETDREGVLQDVHWSYGSFGYFPTYTLGNLYAAQFTNMMKKELDMPELLKKGELGTILSWLREHIHQYGSLYWPKELVEKVTGEQLNPKYFLDYIQDKYSQRYSLR